MSEIKTQYYDLDNKVTVTFYEKEQVEELVFAAITSDTSKEEEDYETIDLLTFYLLPGSQPESRLNIVLHNPINSIQAGIVAQYLAYFGTHNQLPSYPLHFEY